MKKQKIQFICSKERIKKAFSGSAVFKEFDQSDFQILYYDVPEIEGYTVPTYFPFVDSFFEAVYKEAENYIKVFPNCCEGHKKLIDMPWFDKSKYDEFPSKLSTQLYLTSQYLESRTQDEYWYKEVTDYIQANILSFGQLPLGFGSPVGLHMYSNLLKAWMQEYSKLPDDLLKRLYDYLDKSNTNSEPNPSTDLNLLFETYKKWLSLFPFNIEYFKNQKEDFIKIFPLFADKIEYNRFTGLIGGMPHSLESLSELLFNITSSLLQKVNSKELLANGLISDVAKLQLDLINETHTLKQSVLLNKYDPNSTRYVSLLSNWLSNEKEYFKDVLPLLKEPIAEIPDKSDSIRKALFEYGFDNLPLVKVLNQSRKEKLIDLILNNDLPYQIAMLDYLKFFDLLLKTHFNSKYKMFKHLGLWLNDGINIRAIKGNVNVLSKKSTEDRSKYTAHLHKETVTKDYQHLK